VPSLDLRFADNKSLVDATTGQNLVTFTRASSGTFVGSDGLIKTATTDEPRFDHNPTTRESLGLLVEESRTNLLLQSEDFSTTWTSSNLTTTANQIAAPTGATTADLVTGNAGTSIKRLRQNVLTTSLGPWTFSVWLKTGTAASVLVALFDSSAGGANNARTTLTFSTGAVSTAVVGGTATSASASVQNFGNGWHRVSLTGTFVTALTSVWAEIWLDGFTSTASETSFYTWGAQLEAGSFPTSYIPTTTATVTRSADVASISGSNFSSWYRQDEGTFFSNTELLQGVTAANRFIFEANEGVASTGDKWDMRRTGGASIRSVVRDSGINIADRTVNNSSNNIRGAAALQSTSFALAANGSAANEVAISPSATPTLTQLVLNAGIDTSNLQFNGTIRRLTYWPTRLPNSTLQAITQ
jgi:hypothetical protein